MVAAKYTLYPVRGQFQNSMHGKRMSKRFVKGLFGWRKELLRHFIENELAQSAEYHFEITKNNFIKQNILSEKA